MLSIFSTKSFGNDIPETSFSSRTSSRHDFSKLNSFETTHGKAGDGEGACGHQWSYGAGGVGAAFSNECTGYGACGGASGAVQWTISKASMLFAELAQGHPDVLGSLQTEKLTPETTNLKNFTILPNLTPKLEEQSFVKLELCLWKIFLCISETTLGM